jgi:hypothetical protein
MRTSRGISWESNGRPVFEPVLYHLSVVLRRLRYSRWVAGPRHRELARNHLRPFFVGLNNFLQGLEVDYWLAYGTLLGYFREADLILGDSDIDFGLPESAYQTVKDYAHRLPSGYVLADTSHRHGGPKLYVRNGLFSADLYFYREVPGGHQVYLNSPWLCDSRPVPGTLLLPSQPGKFLGQPTRLPNQVEELLIWTYGYLGADGRLDPATGVWYPPTGGTSHP